MKCEFESVCPSCLQVKKALELYEQLRQRMGVVVVGPSGSGKTTLWRVLRQAMIKNGKQVKEYVMNPKAMPRQQVRVDCVCLSIALSSRMGHQSRGTVTWNKICLPSTTPKHSSFKSQPVHSVKPPSNLQLSQICDANISCVLSYFFSLICVSKMCLRMLLNTCSFFFFPPLDCYCMLVLVSGFGLDVYFVVD